MLARWLLPVAAAVAATQVSPGGRCRPAGWRVRLSLPRETSDVNTTVIYTDTLTKTPAPNAPPYRGRPTRWTAYSPPPAPVSRSSSHQPSTTAMRSSMLRRRRLRRRLPSLSPFRICNLSLTSPRMIEVPVVVDGARCLFLFVLPCSRWGVICSLVIGTARAAPS